MPVIGNTYKQMTGNNWSYLSLSIETLNILVCGRPERWLQLARRLLPVRTT
jgi:hypothetical protein